MWLTVLIAALGGFCGGFLTRMIINVLGRPTTPEQMPRALGITSAGPWTWAAFGRAWYVTHSQIEASLMGKRAYQLWTLSREDAVFICEALNAAELARARQRTHEATIFEEEDHARDIAPEGEGLAHRLAVPQ